MPFFMQSSYGVCSVSIRNRIASADQAGSDLEVRMKSECFWSEIYRKMDEPNEILNKLICSVSI